MTIPQQVKELYSNPVYVCEWRGYKVYAQDYGNSYPAIGLPQFAIFKNDNARLTKTDEAFDIIKTLPDED